MLPLAAAGAWLRCEIYGHVAIAGEVEHVKECIAVGISRSERREVKERFDKTRDGSMVSNNV